MDKIIKDDGKRFTDAMKLAGLNPTLKLGGVEMINALDKYYEDDVDETGAAAELGLTKEQFVKAAADADRKFKPLLRRLEQNTVIPRDQFEIEFAEIARNLTDDNIVKVAGGAVPKAAIAKPPESADIALTSDKDVYHQGDTPVFTIVSNRDCFLTLTNVDDKGEGRVLLPNKFRQQNFIKAGRAVKFPADDAPFIYRMRDRGFETVIAVCTANDVSVDGIKHDFAKSAFTAVPDYTRGLARSIVIEARKPAAVAARRREEKHGGRQIFRTAIKVEVK